MTVTVIACATVSYMEEIEHTGDDACLVCHLDYIDNSRVSRVCKSCRPIYERQQKREAYHRRKALSTK